MNIRKSKQVVYLGIIVCAIISLVSCSNPTDSYKTFVANEPAIYPEQPDTVIAFSGIKNVIFKVPKPSQPIVAKVGFFWNNGNDSLKVKFPAGKDTVRVKIDGFNVTSAKRDYLFQIYTYSAAGDRSIKYTKVVTVFGENFLSSLELRPISYVIFKNQSAMVYWGKSPDGSIGTVLHYTNKSNQADSVFVPPNKSKTHIAISKSDSSVKVYDIYNIGTNNLLHSPTEKKNLDQKAALIVYGDRAEIPASKWGLYYKLRLKLNTSSTQHVYRGQYALEITSLTSGSWLWAIQGPVKGIDVSKYSKLQFAIYTKADGIHAEVRLRGIAGKNINVNIKNDSYTIVQLPIPKKFNNRWQKVIIGDHNSAQGQKIWIDNIILIP